ncbi:glycosyltransferase family 2 protein [Methanocaldococcus sp.]
MDKLVSCILCTHNRKKMLERTIISLLNSSYKNLEVIVVDNASSDGTFEYVKERFPQVKIIKSQKNLLAAGGINYGLPYLRGEYILLLADDVIVENDTIKKLVKFLDSKEDAGIVCPVVYYWKDKSRIWWAGSKINMVTSRTYFYGRELKLPKKEFWETDSYTTIMLARKDVFIEENGKLFYVNTEEFPIHNEEADFSFRAKMKGWKLYVLKTAKAYHDISLPEETREKARLFHVHNELRAYYTARNRIIFHKKYSKWWQFLIFISIFNWLFTLYYLRVILLGSKKPFKERLKIAKSYLKGVVEGIKWKKIVK